MDLFNETQYAHYPFVSGADFTFTAPGGSITLPRGLLLGAAAFTGTGDEEAIYLYGVYTTPTQVRLLFGTGAYGLTHNSGLISRMLLVLAPETAAEIVVWNPGDNSLVAGADPSDEVYLHVIPNWDAVAALLTSVPAAGTWYTGMVQLEPAVHTHTDYGRVSRLVFDPATPDPRNVPFDLAPIEVQDDVTVAGGWNTSTSHVNAYNAMTLRVSFVAGTGAGRFCCLPQSATGVILRSLNSIAPDHNGNIRLQGGPGVRIEPVPEEHKVIIHLSESSRTCQ